MSFEKVKNATGYLKNKQTGVVINTNDAELQKVLAAREKAEKSKLIEDEVQSLKTEIKDVKSMLTQILDRLSN